MGNKLICIGWIGTQQVYLNISREEAISRYLKRNIMDDIGETPIKEIEFKDEFCAYSLWEDDMCDPDIYDEITNRIFGINGSDIKTY